MASSALQRLATLINVCGTVFRYSFIPLVIWWSIRQINQVSTPSKVGIPKRIFESLKKSATLTIVNTIH